MLHYAWVIAGTSMLVVFGALGLARFAFGMVLPAMAVDLTLDYRQQGFLGASYFLGYLLVVAVMHWLAPKLGPRRLCAGGMSVVAAGLLAMAMVRDYAVLSGSYFVVGLGSGAAFIGAMALPSFWFRPSHRARGAGIAVAGAGLGILLSGLLVPRVVGAWTLAPWQLVWLCAAALSLAIALLAARLLHDHPAQLGLAPFGNESNDSRRAPVAAGHIGVAGQWRFLLHLGTVYAVFGVTGLSYLTFIVTAMVDDFTVAVENAGRLWAVIGALSMFSGAVFGYVSDRFGHRAAMSAALVVQAVACLAVAGDAGSAALYVSITLFGLAAWSMPTIVAAATGDYLGAENAAAGFSVLTLMFAVGQAIGPAGTGALANWTGGFSLAFGLCAGLNVLAAALSMRLGPPGGAPSGRELRSAP